MVNTENLRILARTALESGAHEDLYKYGSAMLETNTEDGDAWIYKAAGAALNTDETEKRAKEARVLASKAMSFGMSEETARLAAKSFFDAYKMQTNHLDNTLFSNVKDYQKVAMPKGGSAVVHGFAQSLNKVLSAKAQAPARAACIELPLLACSLDPSKENFITALKLVETLDLHAKQNGDYFSDSEYSDLPRRIHREILAKAKDKISDFTPSTATKTNGISKSEMQKSDSHIRNPVLLVILVIIGIGMINSLIKN